MYHAQPDPALDVVAQALDHARQLAALGVPLFVARPATEHDTPRQQKTGFVLPAAWEQTTPDPAVVDRWRPGMALCAVMGHGLDLLDLDPRNGGTLPEGFPVPTSYGIATTPNGGLHSYIRALAVGSRDGVFPGIDVKGGRADGTGHGFAFLPPTVKRLKDGETWGPYTWVQPPDITAILGSAADTSGHALGARVTELLASKAAPKAADGGWMADFANAQRAPQSSATADRAVRRELEAVSGWTAEVGGFRQVLLRAAFVLGGYVGAGHLTEDDASDYLAQAVRDCWGEPDDDDLTWIAQGLADGRGRPFLVYSAADQMAGPAVAPLEGGQEVAIKWSFYDAIGHHPFDPRTDGSDQALAEAVLERVYPGLRASADSDSWVVRGEQVWEEAPDLSDWAVAQVARLMPLGESPVPKDHADRTEFHWQAVRRAAFMSSAGGGKVSRKMRYVTRSAHPASLKMTEMDNDPGVLWAGGVPWDLELSAFEPVPSIVDPATPHLHTARFRPDASVDTPLWDAFIASVWPDPATRAWALRVLSVAVTGHSPRVLPVLYGEGGRGKSQVIELIAHVLGTYGGEGDSRLVTNPDAHASIVYALKGKRLVYIDEPPSAQHDKIERLKMLTGGGRLTGNAMRQNPISFSPTHTLIMMTNEPPVLTDDALRDRAKVIDCSGDPAEVSARRKALGWVSDQKWSEAWNAEAPGVLAALMRESAAWIADTESTLNTRSPLGSQAAVAEMVAAADPIQRWVEEQTVPAEPGTVSGDLHRAFALWFSENPEYRRRTVPGIIAFGKRLTKLGVGTTAMRDGKYRHLVFKSFGGWGNSQPVDKLSTEVTLTYEPVTGTPATRDGFETPSVTPENPSSGPVLTDLVSGVTDCSLVPTKELNNTYKEIYGGIGAEPANSAHSPQNSVKPQVNPSVTSPGAPETHPAPPSAPRQLSRTAAAKVRAAAKAEEKAAAKAQKIADAAGPHIGLPAAMRRGQEPRHITLDEAWAIVTACLARTGGRLAVDVENTARPIGHPDYAGRTVQLGDDMEGIDLDLDDADSRELARRACHEASELNAHNATADLAPLAYIDVVDYRAAMSKMVDTAILMKLSNPKDVGNEAGLKDLAPALLGVHALSPAADAEKAELFKAMGCLTEVKPETPLAKNGWAQVDSGCRTMIRYAISDVLDCSAIRRVIPMPDATVLAREQRVQVITSPSALVGVQLDSGRIQEQIAERTPVVAELGRKLAAVGLENANSPKQVNETFAKVGLALPDTTKETLQKITALHTDAAVKALAQTVLDYRKGSKFMSSFLNPWLEQCEHGDGIVRPTIYTLGADTGRMSCVRPNAQQLPKKGGARECWLAGEGMKIIAGDFSSVEVRVIAALSQDPVLMKMLDDGLKLHDQIALQVFGPGYTETQRTWAKSGVFAHFFGAGIERIAITIQSTMEVAQAVVDAIAIVAPGVHAWTQRVQAQVRAGMSTFTTYSGRVIHLDTKRPYAAVNYMVQGTAREILVDALIKWDDGPYGGGLVLPVHDELLAWVPSGVAEEASLYLEWCLTAELGGVRIMCEMDPPADRWMSAKS